MDGDFDDGKECNSVCNGDRQVVISRDEEDFRDEMDRLPNGCHVTYWDILVLFVSIVSHLLDVAFDINLAYRYLIQKQITYFVLTTAFIMFPAFVNTFVSVRMYVVNDDNNSPSRMVIKKWTIRIFMLIFQLAPIMRYCDSLDYALKSRRAEKRKDLAEQKRNYLLMLKEDSDVALLRVFECFLEAAPQQILQIAIVLKDSGSPSSSPQGTSDYFQLFNFIFVSDNPSSPEFILMLVHQSGSIVSSLLSMAWSMASYHRSIRFCQADKSNLTWPASVIQFLWHFMVTVSRILSISAVASMFPIVTGVCCCMHWIAMTFWLALFEQTQFAIAEQSSLRAKLSEIIFCSILGLVYIFTYLTPSEGNTRNRYLVYYPICFVENITATVLWSTFISPETRHSWYYYPLLISSIVPFIIGIIFMLLFYHFFHPKTSRRITTTNVYSPKVAATQTTRQDTASIRDIVTDL